jgi:hypothetical protein
MLAMCEARWMHEAVALEIRRSNNMRNLLRAAIVLASLQLPAFADTAAAPKAPTTAKAKTTKKTTKAKTAKTTKAGDAKEAPKDEGKTETKDESKPATK